ncbi:MafI family immunity protein [Lelliottia aquatilis]|uniref:MafI family immunity protein n=1 Tax=Lelliottia aquatilis TaxID=2080838 RepID=UPI001576930B|nr:MafI family immunity protein [Lelliottia aquatilis]NTZ48687.1 MafI family immunity protein [Lelliottia aquatilis]
MNANYDKIEKKFGELINSLKEIFTQPELNEVIEFIKHNEFGLAFDTTIDIIIEESKIIDKDTFHLITNLCTAMELDLDNTSNKLSHHVH